MKLSPVRIADDKYPTSVIFMPKEHKKGAFYHPTQKPVALMEYPIRTYTDEGDVVLDNCIGSGTTAVALSARDDTTSDLKSNRYVLRDCRTADSGGTGMQEQSTRGKRDKGRKTKSINQ